jgi:hypothetical protein
MARGYYNHVESRISAYFPGVTRVDQVKIENIMHYVEGQDSKEVPAIRFSYTSPDGTRHAITSIDFVPHFEAHDSTVQGSMAHAAAVYRKKGEVILDEASRTDRIPSHLLNIRLPNGRILYTQFILHQDDELDQRRLVIAEAEINPRARQPGLFMASVGIINPKFFGTSADHTTWRVRYTAAGPPQKDARLVATQPWGLGEFGQVMSAGGEAIPAAPEGAPRPEGGGGQGQPARE